MKILITGGAGFIGSHLQDRLIKEGHKVVVVDNLSTGKKENINKKAKFYKVDILSPKIFQIFQKEKPEIVFHLAAQTNVRRSLKDPVHSAKVDILGSLNLIRNFTQLFKNSSKTAKFVFTSSVGVYGEPKILPISETHPLNPCNSYAIAKLTVENYLKFYHKRGLNFTILRYANVYGPRQISKKGEGGVVVSFIENILKKEKPIIFGKGNQTRDFLYVEDAVNALILSQKAPSGSIYNVGTNKETSIKELLSLILKILDEKIIPKYKPKIEGEISRSRIDYSKINKELNWEPKWSLNEGLLQTINYFKNLLNLR